MDPVHLVFGASSELRITALRYLRCSAGDLEGLAYLIGLMTQLLIHLSSLLPQLYLSNPFHRTLPLHCNYGTKTSYSLHEPRLSLLGLIHLGFPH